MRRNCTLFKDVVRRSESLTLPNVERQLTDFESLSMPAPKFARYVITNPNSFLIEDSRLTRSERVWQKIYVAVPITGYILMLSLPLSLAYSASIYRSA